ncbi:1,4-dihydroxy-2-naphthoate octaprenyltransferase [compost metagenome]
MIVAIGIASVAMGYSYTAGPFPLAYLGLGDLFVILFFGLIAVLGMVFLHGGTWPQEAWILGLQIGFHATVLIAINNLRDVHGDKLVNKKTLAVRMGVPFARFEIAFFAFAPFVLNLYWLLHGFTWAAFLPLLALPLAIKIAKNVFSTEPSPAYNKFLGQSAGLHLVFGLLLALGFLI